MDITFNSNGDVTMSPGYNRVVTVTASNVEVEDILSNIPVSDAAEYYNHDDLLDEIGEEAARRHFNIPDTDD